jgi:hypothetical protein
MVVRLSGAGFNAANGAATAAAAKNLLVCSVAALVLVVMPVNGQPLVPEGPIAAATVTPSGKMTYTPTTGHSNDSFCIEHWFADIGKSHKYTGNRVASMDLGLPASGMSTCDIAMMGQDRSTLPRRTVTTPLAPTTTGVATPPLRHVADRRRAHRGRH